jgi:hypothetical protein
MEKSADHKSFTVKFLHITGKAQVYKAGNIWMAFIQFPACYLMPGANNYAIPNIFGRTVDEVAEIAYMQFKEFYAVLDKPLRLIGKHNFFVTRKRFHTSISKKLEHFTGSFTFTGHYFCISENVDGTKFFKTIFGDRNQLNTLAALMVINWNEFVLPVQQLGFNKKFLGNLMIRHDKVKAHHLRYHYDKEVFDEVAKHPDKITKHVSLQREEFFSAMVIHKMKPPTD